MSVTNDDMKKFEIACDKIINRNCLTGGIGTLSEKTMHAVLKNFYEPDESHQEIKIGRYVADIFFDDEIIEIQTRAFNKLRGKLQFFLEKYPVTVVYPIVRNKQLFWMSPETGEITETRKSPKKASPLDAFREIYKIKMFLKDPNLNIVILQVDAEEYRLLNKNPKYSKYHTERYDRIPTALVDEYVLKTPKDYASVLPQDLPEKFSVKQLAKAGKVTRGTAGIIVNVMKEVGAIEHIDTVKREYIYRKCV